jgi:hypothetical protein
VRADTGSGCPTDDGARRCDCVSASLRNGRAATNFANGVAAFNNGKALSFSSDGTQFTGPIGALSFESVATLYADLDSLDLRVFQHCVDLAVHKRH